MQSIFPGLGDYRVWCPARYVLIDLFVLSVELQALFQSSIEITGGVGY